MGTQPQLFQPGRLGHGQPVSRHGGKLLQQVPMSLSSAHVHCSVLERLHSACTASTSQTSGPSASALHCGRRSRFIRRTSRTIGASASAGSGDLDPRGRPVGDKGSGTGPDSSATQEAAATSSAGTAAAGDAYSFAPPPGDLLDYVLTPEYENTDIDSPQELAAARSEAFSEPMTLSTVNVAPSLASRAQITPVSSSGGVLGVLPAEGLYYVELERDYSKQWPGLQYVVTPDGKSQWQWQWGFLEPFVDPDLPPYYFYKGVEYISFSAGERAAQSVATIAYLATIAVVSTVLYVLSPHLLATASVSWARNTLSLGKWAVLLGLFAVGKLWLYWVFLAAKLTDGVLERYAPGVRKFMWANFLIWALYVALTPAHWYPAPWIAGSP